MGVGVCISPVVERLTNLKDGQVSQIGTNIADIREAVGMTQANLARKIRVSRQTICNYESGYSVKPLKSYATLTKIANALSSAAHVEITVEDLLKNQYENPCK